MMLGPYAYFIVMSYAVAAAIVLNLIGWIAYPVGRSKSPGYGHLKLPHPIFAVSAAEQR